MQPVLARRTLNPPHTKGTFVIKPLWAIAGITLLGTAGTVGALFVSTQGGEEEALQEIATASPEVIIASHAASPLETPPNRTPGPPLAVTCDANRENAVGGQVYRWGDLLLGVPDGSRVVVARGDPKAVGLIIQDDYGGAWSSVQVDSKTGEAVYETIHNTHLGEMAEVVESKLICSFDAASAPWLYSATPPTVPEETRFNGFVFTPPDPAAGIEISWGVSEGGIGPFLEVRSARSKMFVYVMRAGEYQGTRFTPGTVHPDDYDAFERLAQSAKSCGFEVPCETPSNEPLPLPADYVPSPSRTSSAFPISTP